jgi:hypothetical protein
MTKDASPAPGGKTIVRYAGTGQSNQADSFSSADVDRGGSQRFLYAYAIYSGAATQAGVTFEIDSSYGSAYDITLSTGSANARGTSYIPGDAVVLLPGDKIRVQAPAGGAVTASVVIVLEQS